MVRFVGCGQLCGVQHSRFTEGLIGHRGISGYPLNCSCARVGSGRVARMLGLPALDGAALDDASELMSLLHCLFRCLADSEWRERMGSSAELRVESDA